eukprot:COSAG02_NODE_18561_length_932_cov_1.093637_1_plen_40_part_10
MAIPTQGSRCVIAAGFRAPVTTLAVSTRLTRCAISLAETN